MDTIHLMTTAVHTTMRDQLLARFAPGWPAYLAVPDAWIPHLHDLHEKLVDIDPGYELHQVKTKWGSLRFYINDPFEPECCTKLTNQLTGVDEETLEVEFERHDLSIEHQHQLAAFLDRNAAMRKAIAEAEDASTSWRTVTTPAGC